MYYANGESNDVIGGFTKTAQQPIKNISSEQPCELNSLDFASDIARVEKVSSENTGGHSIRVLNERRVSDSGNLCPLWLEILKSL